MIDTIYIEEEARAHPRARAIMARFPAAEVIPCERYGEVFNRRAQNFRVQKRRPALILARKHGNFVLPAPSGYGIGGERNYYFSHMLNCVYDCRYCFLQGMVLSAHYVVFVNYEDFMSEISAKAQGEKPGDVYFFSGYDCDSLALDGVTGFVAHFLPAFAALPNAWLELRTKSARVRPLLERAPLANCVAAFSLTPRPVGAAWEAGVPPLERRLDAMEQLAAAGWRIGLRFDPLIHYPEWREDYRALVSEVAAKIPRNSIHSVSVGPLRFPKGVYDRMVHLHPGEKLLAASLHPAGGTVSYPAPLEEEMRGTLLQFLDEQGLAGQVFSCFSEAAPA